MSEKWTVRDGDDLTITGWFTEDEIPAEFCVHVFARRFRHQDGDGFGWLGEGEIDLLLENDTSRPISILGKAQVHNTEVTVLSTITRGVPPNARLSLTALVNAAMAGGGEEIPITGFPGFFH